MFNYQYILTKKNLFQCLTGFTPSKFEKLLPKFVLALREMEYSRISRNQRIRKMGGGRKSKLTTDRQKLFFILFYYRHYPTMRLASAQFEIHHSNIHTWVHFLSQALANTLGYQLKLPEVRANTLGQLFTTCPALKEFIVDGTEREIQRPKNPDDQQKYYSGKKKRHTVKNQVVINPRTRRILSVSDTVEGKMHDHALLDQSHLLVKAPPGSRGLGDLGYEGVKKDYPWISFCTPLKKKAKTDRTAGEKQTNKVISSIRVKIEHVIGKLKVNRILADKFRNRLVFSDLVFKNCAGLYNFNLNYS